MKDDLESLDIQVVELGLDTIDHEADLLSAFAADLVRDMLALISED